MKRGYSLRDNRTAAIEGLPLYLIIIIVITVIGLGIVLSMMNTVRPPATIDKITISPEVIEAKYDAQETIYIAEGKTVTIRVLDSNSDPVKGAVVRLTGCGVKEGTSTAYLTTGSDGKAEFTDINCELVDNNTGHIEVEVEKSGLGKKTGTITVMPVD
jgi:hypothetical protein